MSFAASFRAARHATPGRYFAAVMAVSASLLGTALMFQYLGGLEPCVLCQYQRIPYWAALGLGGLGLALTLGPARAGWGRVSTLLAGLCGLGFAIGAGVAVFHVGVEQEWWRGTEACVGTAGDAQTIAELRAAIMAAPAALCDQVAWRFLGLSMAGWNALISAALAGATWMTVSQWRTRAKA